GEGNECLINVLYDLKYLYRKMNEEECVNKRVFTWIERVYYNLFFWIDQYDVKSQIPQHINKIKEIIWFYQEAAKAFCQERLIDINGCPINIS
ncbi:hypothetical protein, partial [Paraclostridium bifermentans]